MSRNSTHINCNQVAGTVNQGIWKNDCDPCATSPYLIPNIKLWHRYNHDIVVGGTLRATPADILANVNDGDSVDEWKDQIGTNHAVQSTGADKPTWYATDKSLKFTTNEHYDLTSAVTYAAADPFTILLSYVPLIGTTPSNVTLWQGNSGNDYIKWVNTTTIEFSVGGTTQTITGPAIQTANYTNFVLRKDVSQNCQFFIAGVPWGSVFTFNASYVISEYGATGDGYIAAHMQFDRDLTDKEIWCLDCYNSNQDDTAEPVSCRIDRSRVDCHGGTTTLTANMVNAVGGVTYSWNTSPTQTTQTATGLSVGTYICTMTDSASPANVVTCTGVVEGPAAALACTVAGVNPYYSATSGLLIDGSVTVNVTGGTAPYTYAWTLNGSAISPNPGSVTTFAVSTAGTYAVTVTDINGCTTTCNVVITVPNPPSELNIECCYEAPACRDTDVGFAILMDSTATFPVTISPTGSVSGAQSAITVSALPSSTTVNTATYDNHPCTGSGPWYYETNSSNYLAPGETWSLVVADSSSPQRTQTCTVTLLNPPALGITSSVQQPTACESGGAWSNGHISYVGTAGTAPYTYQITNTTASPNVVVATTNILANPAAMPTTYELKVTDANGCEATQNVTLTCPLTANLTVTPTDVSCDPQQLEGPPVSPPCDGTAAFVANPTSVGGYTFTAIVYDPSGTPIQTYGPVSTFSSQTLNNLCAGTYTWTYIATEVSSGTDTIVDSGSFTVNVPAAIVTNITGVAQPTCSGSATGTVGVTNPSGGTAPYTYVWTGTMGGVVPTSPSQVNSQNLTGLVAGCYTVVVTDAKNCTWTGTQCLSDGCDPVIYGNPGSIPCAGGTTNVNISAPYCGLPPYTYSWVASNGGAIPSGQGSNPPPGLTGVTAGTYTVTVTDSNSPACTSSTQFNVLAGAAITGSITPTHINCKGERTGAAQFDQWNQGQFSGATYLWTTDAGYTTPVSAPSNNSWISSRPAGTYYLRVTLSNGCVWEGSTTITEPGAGMNLSAVVTDANDCLPCCGEIDLTVTGGSTPYTYLWSNGETTQDLSCVYAGTYTVVVTDDAGCTATATYTVNTVGGGTAMSVITSYTSSTNQLNVTVTGGQPGYYYAWTLNGNPFSYSQNPLGAGNGLYCVTVTDSYGCTHTACHEVITNPHEDPSFNCVSKGCVAVSSGGTYSTLAACIAACETERPVKWFCEEGQGCVQHPYGTYNSQAACQAVCGVNGSDNPAWICEILCEEETDGERYDSEERRESSGTGGGRCRPNNGTDADNALTQYQTYALCVDACPWCKEDVYEY